MCPEILDGYPGSSDYDTGHSFWTGLPLGLELWCLSLARTLSVPLPTCSGTKAQGDSAIFSTNTCVLQTLTSTLRCRQMCNPTKINGLQKVVEVLVLIRKHRNICRMRTAIVFFFSSLRMNIIIPI